MNTSNSALSRFYIPDKIADKLAVIDNKIPPNFSDRFAKMEANLQNMQDRLNRITPASLNDLILSPGATMSPAMLTTRLRQASAVIDVALKSQIPAAPDSLAPLMMRVDDIQSRHKDNPKVREAVDSLDVRLLAYKDASKQLLMGVAPITVPSDVPKSMPDHRGIANLNMICINPTAHFLAVSEGP